MHCAAHAGYDLPDGDRLCQCLTVQQRTILQHLGQQRDHIVYIPGRGWNFGGGAAVGERLRQVDVALLAVRGLILLKPCGLLRGYSISALGRQVLNCMRSRGAA
jgi:hypothetical protein